MNIFILCLLFPLSGTEALLVSLRRTPAGIITESQRANLTLHCLLQESQSGPVESVAWYYQGDLLRTIPDTDCLEGSGSAGDIQISSEVMELSDISQDFQLIPGEVPDLRLEGDYSGSGDHLDLELSGMGELCGVDPTELVLYEVNREFSGDYSCAVVSGGVLGPTSELLHLSVQCKNLFFSHF